MPSVKMPDGTLVDMPDNLSPDQGKRLRAMLSGAPKTPENQLAAGMTQLEQVEPGRTVEPTPPKLHPMMLRGPAMSPGMFSTVLDPFPTAGSGGSALEHLAGAAVGPLSGAAFQAGRKFAGAPFTAATRIPTLPQILKGGAEKTMAGALKPTAKEYGKEGIQDVAQTMLEKGYSVSEKGYKKMQQTIGDLASKVSAVTEKSPATVSVKDVMAPLGDLEGKFVAQVNPERDIRAAQRTGQEFLRHPAVAGQERIPVPVAQRLKAGTYEQLERKRAYAPGEMKEATVQAQKALARGLKEGIEKEAPEVIELNREQQRIYRAMPMVERRIFNDAMRNPGGLHAIADQTGMLATFLDRKSAGFKSLIAHLLNATGKGLSATGRGMATAAPASGIVVPAIKYDPSNY